MCSYNCNDRGLNKMPLSLQRFHQNPRQISNTPSPFLKITYNIADYICDTYSVTIGLPSFVNVER